MNKFALLYKTSANLNENHSAKSNTTLPASFQTLAEFDSFADTIRKTTGIKWLAYTPYLSTPEMKVQWEEYAKLNQDWIEDASGHSITDFIWQYNDTNGTMKT